MGKNKQHSLFKRWGGSPSIILLRHTCSLLTKSTRQRYHEKLKILLQNINLPTEKDELADSESSDIVYESCVDYLREATRDKEKYRMIFAENVNYGFRRNLWAMKPAALFILGISVCGLFASIGITWKGFFEVPAEIIAALLINIILLIYWVFFITTEWVKIPAFEYARQLLSSLET